MWCEQDDGPRAATDARPRFQVPRRLGPVELIREIGRGGMGVVWLARHRLLRKNVAVKFVLVPNASEAEIKAERERFLDGASIAASLRHPGLTAVLHADVVNGIPYVVMEYVNGRTVANVLKSFGRLDVPKTLALLEATCRIVADLHHRQIVHRDLKPSNLLLDRSDRLFVTDFGLACNRLLPSQRTPDGGIAGTPAYMAPEMFDGTVSTRSDVYALGIMTYELLVGRRPFDGQYVAAHRSVLPPLPLAPLRRVNVPEQVINVIGRATNRNPMFRIKSAGQLLAILETELGPWRKLDAGRLLHESLRPTRVAGTVDSSHETASSSGSDGSHSINHIASAKRRQRADSHPSTPEPARPMRAASKNQTPHHASQPWRLRGGESLPADQHAASRWTRLLGLLRTPIW